MTHLDLAAIRRDAHDGLPVLPATVVALCDRCEALERALRPFAEQQYSDLDALLTARRLLGLSEFPPLSETLTALRELVGAHFDGVDPVAYVAELRGDAVLDAARAYLSAVDRGGGIAAAEQALREAVEGKE